MKQLSNAVNTLILEKNISYFFLVSLDIPSAIQHYTSLPYDITMGDGNTYSSENGVYGVDPPHISDIVDREAYKVALSDPSFNFKYYFEDGIIGREMSVRLGFINTTESEIEGFDSIIVQPGEIFKDINDTILIYAGAVDNHGYTIDISNSEAIAAIEGSSPMADLDLVKTFYTSKDSMSHRNNTDTAFDSVHEGSGTIQVRWGKVK